MTDSILEALIPALTTLAVGGMAAWVKTLYARVSEHKRISEEVRKQQEDHASRLDKVEKEITSIRTHVRDDEENITRLQQQYNREHYRLNALENRMDDSQIPRRKTRRVIDHDSD